MNSRRLIVVGMITCLMTIATILVVLCFFRLNREACTLFVARVHLSQLSSMDSRERVRIAISLRKMDAFTQMDNQDLLLAYDPWYYFVTAIDELKAYQTECLGKAGTPMCQHYVYAHDQNLNAAMAHLDFIQASGGAYADAVLTEYRQRPPQTHDMPRPGDREVVVSRGLYAYAPVSGWTFVGEPRVHEGSDPWIR